MNNFKIINWIIVILFLTNTGLYNISQAGLFGSSNADKLFEMLGPDKNNMPPNIYKLETFLINLSKSERDTIFLSKSKKNLETPLQKAIRHNFFEAATYLVRFGADGTNIFVEESNYSTPLIDYAIKHGFYDLALEIAKRPGSCTPQSAFLLISHDEFPENLIILKTLVASNGKNILERQSYFGTVLARAVLNDKSLSTISFLLQLGANPNVKLSTRYKQEELIVDYAARTKKLDLFKLLVSYGAKVSSNYKDVNVNVNVNGNGNKVNQSPVAIRQDQQLIPHPPTLPVIHASGKKSVNEFALKNRRQLYPLDMRIKRNFNYQEKNPLRREVPRVEVANMPALGGVIPKKVIPAIQLPMPKIQEEKRYEQDAHEKKGSGQDAHEKKEMKVAKDDNNSSVNSYLSSSSGISSSGVSSSQVSSSAVNNSSKNQVSAFSSAVTSSSRVMEWKGIYRLLKKSNQELEQSLLTGTAQRFKPLDIGIIQDKYVITLSTSVEGVFKPDLIGGNVDRSWKNNYQHEIAAYLVDKIMGFNLIPPTVSRTFDLPNGKKGVRGSLQLYMAGHSNNDYHKKKHSKELLVLDFLLHNCDRHYKNVLLDISEQQEIAIDNGLAFNDLYCYNLKFLAENNCEFFLSTANPTEIPPEKLPALVYFNHNYYTVAPGENTNSWKRLSIPAASMVNPLKNLYFNRGINENFFRLTANQCQFIVNFGGHDYRENIDTTLLADFYPVPASLWDKFTSSNLYLIHKQVFPWLTNEEKIQFDERFNQIVTYINLHRGLNLYPLN